MTSVAPPDAVLRAQQDALAAHIRDPDRVAPPEGVEARRLKIYRELFFNNVDSLLAGNFPVLRRIHGDDGWRALVRAFYRDHDCHTPLFTELAREFLRYLDERAAGEAGHDDPPWLRELAHYEWVELALQISEASCDDVAHDPDGDLLAGAKVSYMVGREANSKFNETLNGIRAKTPHHQFTVKTDPFKKAGDPDSAKFLASCGIDVEVDRIGESDRPGKQSQSAALDLERHPADRLDLLARERLLEGLLELVDRQHHVARHRQLSSVLGAPAWPALYSCSLYWILRAEMPSTIAALDVEPPHALSVFRIA